MSFWKSKKYKDKFSSSYQTDKKGERVFILTGVKTGRRITFESWQAAKKLGWKKEY